MQEVTNQNLENNKLDSNIANNIESKNIEISQENEKSKNAKPNSESNNENNANIANESAEEFANENLEITKTTPKKIGNINYVQINLDSMPQTGVQSFKRSVKLTLGLDLFKGLALTIKEFFSKPVTVNYPLEMQPLSPRYRAVHNLQRMLESGNERCIGCGLCEKICTSNCIRILTSHESTGRKKIDSYTINLGRCIYCGLCAEVCPELAIVMGNRFENASEQRAHFGLKEDFLKNENDAKTGVQLEFEGFGSVTPNADSNVKKTPTGF